MLVSYSFFIQIFQMIMQVALGSSKRFGPVPDCISSHYILFIIQGNSKLLKSLLEIRNGYL